MRAGQAVIAALAAAFGVTLLGLVATGGFDARAAAAPAPASILAVLPGARVDPGEGGVGAPGEDVPVPVPVPVPAPAPAPVAPVAPPPVVDLSAIRAVGDHYEAPYGEGRARLTLVPHIQQRLRDLLERRPPPYAAAVVIDVATGRVLGFAGASSDEPAGAPLLPARPLGPAASVFKLVTAAALLESAAEIEPVCYSGGLRRIRARDLLDDPRRDTRCASLGEAVARSLNVPIGKMALARLDPEALVRAAERFGFNRPLPFDVPVAASSARLPETSLELARTAAGFEGVRLSALHGAVLAGAIAAGGVVRRPGIVERIEGDGAGTAHTFAPETLGHAMEPAAARALGRMMVGTTTDGTARREFSRDPFLRERGVAGKTGSLRDPERDLDFSWFVGFAPAEEPRVAVAAFVANRALWHFRATYVAREALAAALAKK